MEIHTPNVCSRMLPMVINARTFPRLLFALGVLRQGRQRFASRGCPQSRRVRPDVIRHRCASGILKRYNIGLGKSPCVARAIVFSRRVRRGGLGRSLQQNGPKRYVRSRVLHLDVARGRNKGRRVRRLTLGRRGARRFLKLSLIHI